MTVLQWKHEMLITYMHTQTYVQPKQMTSIWSCLSSLKIVKSFLITKTKIHFGKHWNSRLYVVGHFILSIQHFQSFLTAARPNQMNQQFFIEWMCQIVYFHLLSGLKKKKKKKKRKRNNKTYRTLYVRSRFSLSVRCTHSHRLWRL